MLIKTEGIVLRCYQYKENRYLAHILTKDHGVMTYAVYAPQSRRSRTRMSYFQPLTLLLIDADHKPGRAIQTLKEIVPLSASMNILGSPYKISTAMFVAEITNSCILPENPDEQLYTILRETVDLLDSEKPLDGHFPLQFMLSMADYLGFNPAHDEERLVINEFLSNTADLSEQETFLRFVEASRNRNITIFTHSERQMLLRTMLRYFKFNLPDMPQIKSVSVLENLFS